MLAMLPNGDGSSNPDLDDDIGLLDAAIDGAINPLDALVAAGDMEAVEQATARTARDSHVAYSTDDLVMFDYNGNVEVSDLGVTSAQDSEDSIAAIIADRLKNVDLAEAAHIRRNVSLLEASGVNSQVQTVAGYVARLAATRDEVFDFMAYMGDKKAVAVARTVAARKLFAGRKGGGSTKTSAFAYPAQRWKVVRGIADLKCLEVARKYASRPEPKPPLAPTQPEKDDDVYAGVNGLRQYDLACNKYNKDKKEFTLASARHKSAITKRQKTLEKHRALVLKAIDQLGSQFPCRGRWLRLNLPVRNLVLHPKARVCAIEAAKEAAVAAKERSALGDARTAHWDFCRNLSKKEHDPEDLFNGWTSVPTMPKALGAVLRQEDANSAAAAAAKAKAEAEAEAEAEALNAAVAKRLADEEKARVPLWAAEEAAANQKGLEARAEKVIRDQKEAEEAILLAAMKEEQEAADAELEKKPINSVDRWIASVDRQILKVKLWTVGTKTRRVAKSQRKTIKSKVFSFFDIMNPKQHPTSDGVFEDLGDDTGITAGVSSNAAGLSK